MKKNIALLAGGYSGEYEISIQSAAFIARHLHAEQYKVYTILITKTGWFYQDKNGRKFDVNKNNFTLPLADEIIQFDAVFFAIHGSPGEDGKMQGYFDMLGIPYTGCNLITSALTFNKSFCNKVVAAFNIVQVARSFHLYQDKPFQTENISKQLRFPVFVKPAEGGSSIGMSKVSQKSLLFQAIKKAFKEDSQILIEEFIEGRELTCGVFKDKDGVVVLPLAEIKCTKDFFDYEAKYTPGMTEEITPAEIAQPVTKKVQETAKLLYQKLNCKGIVRFDFIWDEAKEELYFLEVNTMPGQSPGSIVPKQLKAAGLSPEYLYGTLIETCFSSVSQ